jgi:tRNA-dependent cyclodipeptide synthase
MDRRESLMVSAQEPRKLISYNFPPQTSYYKVTARKGLGHGDWKNFTSVIFEISLNNSRSQGEYLNSTIKWAEGRFERAYFILCDSLQRHNINFENPYLSEKEAHVKAIEKGNTWLKNNQHYIENSILEFSIYRWDYWLNFTDDYNKARNYLDDLYMNDSIFRNDIDNVCHNFWVKSEYKNKNPSSERDFISRAAKNYILEETAVTSIFAARIKGVSAYPGSLHHFWLPFIELENEFLPGFKNHTFITLDLVRNKSDPSLTSSGIC